MFLITTSFLKNISLSPLSALGSFSGNPIWIKSSTLLVSLVSVHCKKIKSKLCHTSLWNKQTYISYVMPESNIQKKYNPYITSCIYHLLSPGIKCVRLRHNNKFQNLKLFGLRDFKMCVKPLAHLHMHHSHPET